MGLFDRLREMIGGAEPTAAAAPASDGQARAERLAAMRGEARQRRRKDMRERLAALIDPAGTVTGALVRFVNLQPIADEVGAERWADSFARIELMSESVIEREIGGDTLHIAHGTQGFLLLFVQANMEEAAADDLCDTVFDEIRRLLLGEHQTARPRYTVDARHLLRMIDETIPFPFVASTRPPRQRRVPPDAGAGGEAASTDIGPAAAPAPGDTVPGMAWQEWREGAAGGDPQIARSETRRSSPASFVPSGERSGRDADFGRSEERPQGAAQWERSHDRPGAGAGNFGTSSDRAVSGAGSPGRSDDRGGDGLADWGMSRDRATQEWFFGRERRREETDSEVRYVPMGRSNTMFASLTLSYRPFLETKRSAVTSYLLEPALEIEGNRLDAAGLVAQATRYNALPSLDLALLDRAMIEIGPRFEAGVRFLYLVPLSFVTLMRRADRYEFFDRWATVPVSMRKFARFYCYQPSGEIGDTSLQEIATMLRFASREPVFAMAPASSEMRRLGLQRARSMMVDMAAVPPAKLDLLCQAGRQSQLSLYLAGARDRELRRAAFTAGAAFVEGRPLADAAAIPPRPERLSVSGFIDEG